MIIACPVRLILGVLLLAAVVVAGSTGIAAACADYAPVDAAEEDSPGGNRTALWLAGLIGIITVSIKTGSGSGLASLNRGELLGIAGVHSFFAGVLGYIFGSGLNLALILRMVEISPFFYAIMALCLLLLGIYTVKRWQKGADVSRRSFWVLVAPCPLFVIAVILAAGLSAEIFQLSILLIGTLTSSLVFVVIMATALYLRRWRDTPLPLGKLMTAAGLSLLAAVLLLPAYLTNGLHVSDSLGKMMPGHYFVIPAVFLGTFIFLGFVKRRYTNRWDI